MAPDVVDVRSWVLGAAACSSRSSGRSEAVMRTRGSAIVLLVPIPACDHL